MSVISALGCFKPRVVLRQAGELIENAFPKSF